MPEANDLSAFSTDELADQLHANFVKWALPNPVTNSEYAPGAALDAGQRIVAELHRRGLADPEIEAIVRRAGLASSAESDFYHDRPVGPGNEPPPDGAEFFIGEMVSLLGGGAEPPMAYSPDDPRSRPGYEETSFDRTGIEDLSELSTTASTPTADSFEATGIEDLPADAPLSTGSGSGTTPTSLPPADQGYYANSRVGQGNMPPAHPEYEGPGHNLTDFAHALADADDNAPLPTASATAGDVFETTGSENPPSAPEKTYYKDQETGPKNQANYQQWEQLTDSGAARAMAGDDPPPTPPASTPPGSSTPTTPGGSLTIDSPIPPPAPPADEVFVPTEYAPDLTTQGSSGSTSGGVFSTFVAANKLLAIAVVLVIVAAAIAIPLALSGRHSAPPSSSPTTPTSTTARAAAVPSIANPSGVRTPGGYSCPQPESTVFQNGNTAAVHNGGVPPTFSVGTPMCLGQIATYHWNKGAGSPGGTLWLVRKAGDPGFANEVGPFSAQGGTTWHATVPNVDYPVVIQGTYQCEDSDPATWSADKESGNQNFCFVFAYPATKGSSTSASSKTTTVPAS